MDSDQTASLIVSALCDKISLGALEYMQPMSEAADIFWTKTINRIRVKHFREQTRL